LSFERGSTGMEEVEIKPEQQTKRNVCYVFYILDAQDSGLFKK
jgi:hypothetical protein